METEAIIEILGGRKVLGKTIKKTEDLTHLIRKGLPAGSITALALRLHISNAVLSRKLRGASICQRVEMIGNEEKAYEWLSTPNRALGGEKAFDQLDTDTDARLMEDILGRIAYGVYS